jgi:PKD repeat protein
MYGTAGNYTVTLVVTDNEGGNGTAVYTLNVLMAPVAIFTYSPDFPIVGEVVTFNASDSYDPNGYVVNYTWDFGDGNITTLTDPIITHTYTITGNYTVTLTVTDNDGFTSIVTPIVRVRDYPTAAFTYSPNYPLIDQTVTFNASISQPNGGVIVSYVWDFGDGNIDSVSYPVTYYAYALIGNYNVTLTVIDSEGLSSIISKSINISPRGPAAHFTWSPSLPKPNETATFDASTSILGWNGTYHPPIILYIWDFGDGNITTVTEPIITHLYPEEEDYVVTLKVVDSAGFEDQVSRIVFISYGREDVNGDGIVDMLDISLAIDAFMTFPGHPLYDPRCDVNLDGVVDMADISRIIEKFGLGW